MAKVIVERPRRGHDFRARFLKGRSKALQIGWEQDSLPVIEAMKANYNRKFSKSLNENLAPLRRFLFSRVGRPWHEVHTEIRKNLSVTNAVQMHVWQHVPDIVEANPLWIGGRPYHSMWYADPRPVTRVTLYVDAEGVLRRGWAPTYNDEQRRLRKQKPAPSFIKLGDNRIAKQSPEGLWFEVTLSKLPAHHEWYWDHWARAGAYVTVDARNYLLHADLEYGDRRVYAAHKRAMSTEEIAALPTK
jgi:hypothetical protein